MIFQLRRFDFNLRVSKLYLILGLTSNRNWHRLCIPFWYRDHFLSNLRYRNLVLFIHSDLPFLLVYKKKGLLHNAIAPVAYCLLSKPFNQYAELRIGTSVTLGVVVTSSATSSLSSLLGSNLNEGQLVGFLVQLLGVHSRQSDGVGSRALISIFITIRYIVTAPNVQLHITMQKRSYLHP